MIDYTSFFQHLSSTELNGVLPEIKAEIEAAFDPKRWGDIEKWKNAYNRLPKIKPSTIDFNSAAIKIGAATDINENELGVLSDILTDFCPWRKGPYDFFGLEIDSEWRSDLKWDRIKDHVSDLKDRLILDVGCGNGYHCYRMGASMPKLVVGIDPTMIYMAQFGVLHKYINHSDIAVLPLGIDDLPQEFTNFDTVFSMGLIYHRRNPQEHLVQLFDLLKAGGEVVLESIVIDGELDEVLVPKDRYAQMRNVWHIPSILTLESWIKESGFTNIRLIDVTQTTEIEQRSTLWSGNKSLVDFLDPSDNTKTIEGYPAPKRAVFLANSV